MPELRLKCEIPADISLRDFSFFVEDVSTLYDRLVFLYVAPSSPIAYSPQFRRILHRLPADLDLGLYDLRRQNPVVLGLKIPEIIAEIKNFFKEGLELGRDWQNVRRRGQLENDRIDIENDIRRTRLRAFQDELDRQRQLHAPDIAKVRLEYEEEMEHRYLTSALVEVQPRLEAKLPKQIPEVANVTRAEVQSHQDASNTVTQAASDTTSVSSSEQMRQKAMNNLGRDINRISQSPINILSIEETTPDVPQDGKGR